MAYVMAYNSELSKNQLEELIRCSICLEIFNEPKVLPCNHTFCNGCLNGVVINNSSKIKCPLCNKEFNVPERGFETDFRANQLLDLYHNTEQNNHQVVVPSAPPMQASNFSPMNNDSVNEPILGRRNSSNTKRNIYSQDNIENSDECRSFTRRDSKYKKRKFYKYSSFGLLIALIIGLILFLIMYLSKTKQCGKLDYLDGNECKPQKEYLEACDSSIQCSDIQSLLCFNGTCNCNKKFTFFNFETKKCTNKKNEFEICKLTKECFDPMECKNQQCQCEQEKYFDETNLKCITKTLYNTPCQSNNTCKAEVGLSCQNNLCQCDSTKKFWLSETNKCVDRYNYGFIGCKSNHECSSNLICNLNENNCSCPLKSLPSMCDCERNSKNYLYWNSKECIPAGLDWYSCTKDYECRYPYECLNLISKCSDNEFLKLLFKTNDAFVLKNSDILQLFLIMLLYIFIH